MISKQSEIKMRLFDLLSQSIDNLTHKEINDIKEDIDAGELALAYETLVTQLYEHDTKLNVFFIATLKELGKELNVDETYWKVFETTK